MRASTTYPNISQWFGPLLTRLRRFDSQEYVVLRWELDHAHEERLYRRDLRLLDQHVALAAQVCHRFSQLIKERSKPGNDLHSANRMILDKLAEVRAIAGLHRMGFEDITHERTPDLSASQGGTTLAVEVARLAASSGDPPITDREIQITILEQRDHDAVRKLADEFFTKIEAKYAQLSRASIPGGHAIWISLGRDYLIAGRYERRLTGLRRKMPGYISDALNLAAAKVQSQLNYPDLRYVVVCLGREEEEVVCRLA